MASFKFHNHNNNNFSLEFFYPSCANKGWVMNLYFWIYTSPLYPQRIYNIINNILYPSFLPPSPFHPFQFFPKPKMNLYFWIYTSPLYPQCIYNIINNIPSPSSLLSIISNFFFQTPKTLHPRTPQCNIDSNHCVFSQTVVYFRLPAFTPSLRCFLYLPENQENLQITKYGFARLITFVFSRSNPTKQMFNSISHTTRTFFFFFFFPFFSWLHLVPRLRALSHGAGPRAACQQRRGGRWSNSAHHRP